MKAHTADPVSADLSREHWTKSVPPEPNRSVAGVDPVFVQQILDIP
ncbi:MAG: hypothetical protein ABJE00_07225 [Erythrobacter sp.]